MSNFHGPWLVDVVASLISMGCLALFLKIWQPEKIWTSLDRDAAPAASLGAAAVADTRAPRPRHPAAESAARLVALGEDLSVLLRRLPQVKAFLDGLSVFRFSIEGLHNMVQRVPPVVAKPTPEAAVYIFNWLSMTGTGTVSATIAGKLIGQSSLATDGRVYRETLVRVRFSR